MNSLFSRDLCEVLVLSFGHSLWIGTLIAVVAAVAAVAAVAVRRRRTADARSRVWLAALVALVVQTRVALAADVPTQFMAELPNGIEVELLGISTGEKDSAWWQADGTRLDKPPFTSVSHAKHSMEPRAQCRSFAVRVLGGKSAEFLATFVDGVRPGTSRTDGLDGLLESLTTVGPLDNLDKATVRVAFRLGEFGPPQGLTPQGEKWAVILPDDLQPWYDAISPLGVDEADGQTVLRLAPRDQTARRHVVEWSVTDIDGRQQAVKSAESSNSRTALLKVKFGLPLSRVARFTYRLRPYRHWVTFENVSLQPGQKTNVKVRVEAVAKQQPQPTEAELQAKYTVIRARRAEGEQALYRGDYGGMADIFAALAREPDAWFEDAVWHGHALHLAGKWNEARDAYQRAIALADRRLFETEQRAGADEEEPGDRNGTFVAISRGVRSNDPHRLERERLQHEWPALVYLAGRVELTQLGDAQAAVKTLSRGLRFTGELESLEELAETARAALDNSQEPPKIPFSHNIHGATTTLRVLAAAYERLGNLEGAADCWARIQLSNLAAFKGGYSLVDSGHLKDLIARLPAEKRPPHHELLLEHPSTRRAAKLVPYDHQAALTDDKRNSFRVAATLDGFQMANSAPSHASLAKLSNGRWIMAYTTGERYDTRDIAQSRIHLSTSADGQTWDTPWEFSHNNIFSTQSPSLIVDDDGVLWMLCTSNRLDHRIHSGGYYIWLCSSRDGRHWSGLRPVKNRYPLQFQHTVHLTRDRTGMFWIIATDEIGSAKSLSTPIELKPLVVKAREGNWSIQAAHAMFDERNRCHLLFSDGYGVRHTTSTDMTDWTDPQSIHGERGFWHSVQGFSEGNRIAAFYNGWKSGWFCAGTIEGDHVAWGHPVQIGLPLDGSSIVRDGDRLLLPSGRIRLFEPKGGNEDMAAAVLLSASVADVMKLATKREGVIEEITDKAFTLNDGRVITTETDTLKDAHTKYARLTDKGEEPVERSELKVGVRVRYELWTGHGATKVVILPAQQDGEGKDDAPRGAEK